MKLTTQIFFLIIGFLLLFSSCKKKEVEIPQSNDPVFKTVGTFGSQSFNLIAGDNNAYMYTMTEVVNGVDVVSGKLSNGFQGIELGIYDGYIDFMNSTFTDNVSLTPTYSKMWSSPLLILSKNDFTNSSYIQSIEWIIDGAFAGINTVEIFKPGRYDVCATILFNDGSSHSLCNDMIVGYKKSINDQIECTYTGPSSALLHVGEISNPIQHVDWYIDGALSPLSDTTIAVSTVFGVQIIKAEITYVNGVSRTKSMLIDGAPGHFKSTNDFTDFENTPLLMEQDFNLKVIFKHNGMQFSSELADNTSSSVQINSFQYYKLNSAGYPVYKINADIDCLVRKIGGPSIPLNFSTTFGFEIK